MAVAIGGQAAKVRPGGILQAGCAAAAYAALGLAASRQGLWQGLAGQPLVLGLLVLLATLTFLALTVLTISGLVLARMPAWAEALGAVACGALWWAARHSGLPLLTDVLLILAAGLFGALLSRIVREKDILLPVALAAVLVDTWGVYLGFVSDISKTHPQVVAQLSASVPVAGKAMTALPVLGSIGVGDFAFMGLFLAAVARLRLRWRETLVWLVALLVLGPTLVMAVAALLGHPLEVLPGLVFIVIAVVAANRKHLALNRAEWFALLYTVLVVLGVIGTYSLVRALMHRAS